MIRGWPGVFENALQDKGQTISVIEKGTNGRRTAWSDPFQNGRDGSQGLSELLERYAPPKCVMLMLGTNDFRWSHAFNAWMSA
jgi:lysophospholipase L1-like esterase